VQGRRLTVRKLIAAVAVCSQLAFACTSFGQPGRAGWDGTWVGGWDRGAGVQLIFAGDTLVGFYLRRDYREILRSTVSPGGGIVFRWDKGEATLTRIAKGGALLVVREAGRPEISIPLKREGG
jgi:hypothetical protein